MAHPACPHCHYTHPLGQICPHQLIQIPLGIKDSDRGLGCLIIRYDTTNHDLKRDIMMRYNSGTGNWTRAARLYTMSDRLYTVSTVARCIMDFNVCTPNAKLWDQKTSSHGYVLLDSRFSSRSANIIHWYTSSGSPSGDTLYVEKKFSSRFRWLVAAIVTLLAIGGGVFVYLRGYDSSTQNWLALAAIIAAVILFLLSPYWWRW